MKIYMSTDMEGCACVANADIWIKNSPECQQAQRQLTREVNAAVEGAFAGGATEMVVADLHASGPGNFVLEDLDPRPRYVFGESPVARFPTIDDGTFDGIFFLGYHAMSGTAGACMDDSFVYSINGVRIGELGVDAAVAGHYGVPPLFISGDDKLCGEARALLGELETAEVKQSFDRFHTLSLSPTAACDLIRRKACAAVQRIGAVAPFQWESPITVRKVFRRASEASDARWRLPSATRLDPLTNEYIFDNVIELWSRLKAGLL